MQSVGVCSKFDAAEQISGEAVGSAIDLATGDTMSIRSWPTTGGVDVAEIASGTIELGAECVTSHGVIIDFFG
jgi:hypothetical protein